MRTPPNSFNETIATDAALPHERFETARERLAHRTAAIEHRLASRLEDVRRRHDLTSRLLLTSQRDVVRAVRRGAAPTSARYWETIAEPHAQPLRSAAFAVIDEEVEELVTAVRRFRMAATEFVQLPESSLSTADIADAVTLLVLPLADISMTTRPIDELGASWQRRLRRAAVKSAAQELLVADTNGLEAIVERAELALLDQPPWLHGDRLLSAFEIAHGEVRRELRERVRSVPMVVADLASRQLVDEV